jgi:hypothetical protein
MSLHGRHHDLVIVAGEAPPVEVVLNWTASLRK